MFPTVLIVILTAWSMFIYRRKKRLTLMFVICLVFLSSNMLAYCWLNTQLIYTASNNTNFKATAAFSPKQGAASLVIKTIQSANKYIYVAAYSFTSKPIADALSQAHARGIDIKVVLDNSQKNGRGNLLAYLKHSGILIRINSRYKIMHNKFMIIDGVTLQLGSFNYTQNAEERNAENVLVLTNNIEIVTVYLKNWQKLWLESRDLNDF